MSKDVKSKVEPRQPWPSLMVRYQGQPKANDHHGQSTIAQPSATTGRTAAGNPFRLSSRGPRGGLPTASTAGTCSVVIRRGRTIHRLQRPPGAIPSSPPKPTPGRPLAAIQPDHARIYRRGPSPVVIPPGGSPCAIAFSATKAAAWHTAGPALTRLRSHPPPQPINHGLHPAATPGAIPAARYSPRLVHRRPPR